MKITKLLAGSLLLFAPIIAFAQAGTVTDPDGGTPVGAPPTAAPTNTVSCFDYYTFGSVQANLTAPVTSAVSGTAITFSGTIVNNNPYPIVDGSLYVKIFKSRGSKNDGNGPDVVDQFVAMGDITIPAKGSIPASFAWNVPSYAQSGDYQLATFFTTSRKFNLLGLSFTDDVVGNTVPFRVSGEQKTGVMFSKSGVTVNGSNYFFAAFPPRVSATDPAKVTATIKNTTNQSQQATVSWTVYQWDALLRKNAVQEESHTVTVPAGGSVPASVTVTDTNYPVYLAVGTLTWKDTKSIVGIRFVRDGVDRTRINFPAVTTFPLVKGQETTLFSCLHNSGSSAVVPNGRLELSILDTAGNVIRDYVYTGAVTGAMMGVADTFIPARSYDAFRLEARLYDGDNFIDEAVLDYDCNDIDPSTCTGGGGLPTTQLFNLSSLLGGSSGSITVIIAIIVLLVLIVVARKFLHSSGPSAGPTMAPPPPKV